MELYKVIVSINATGFRIKAEIWDVTETSKSYTAIGLRVAKVKLKKVQSIFFVHSVVFCYCLPQDYVSVVRLCKDHVKESIKKEADKYNNLYNARVLPDEILTPNHV